MYFLQRRSFGANKLAKLTSKVQTRQNHKNSIILIFSACWNFNFWFCSQIVGVAADQEGFTEDSDPAEEDSQAAGRDEGLEWPQSGYRQER